jgi:CRP/FNR family transcriptional regulator
MIPIKVESAWQGTVDCQKCGIRDMVLFADLNHEDFAAMHTPIDDLRFQPRSTLHVEAQKAEFVMTIRSGMVKLIRNIVDGRERIVRVLRQGDVVGLEAIATGQYGHEAVALTELSVCRIPIQLIQQLSTTSPRLHNRLTTQ